MEGTQPSADAVPEAAQGRFPRLQFEKQGRGKKEQDKNTKVWEVEENENGNGSKKKKGREGKTTRRIMKEKQICDICN